MHILILGPVSPVDLSDNLASVPSNEYGRNYGAPVGALCQALLQEGHRVTVITHERGLGEFESEGPALHFIRVRSRSSPRRQILDFFAMERRAMLAAARKVDADVVHAQWTYEWLRVAIALCLPLVVTIHDSPWTVLRHNRGPYWFLRAIHSMWNRMLFPREVQLIAVSQYISVRWRREHLWRRPIGVIPNIVDVGELSVDSAKRVSALNAGSAIEIADASPRKRVRLLVDRYRRLSLPWSLELIGRGLGPDFLAREKYEARNTGRGQSQVRALGPMSRTDALERLDKASIHLHASGEESFGLTVVEALILGVPVVVDESSGGAAENLLRYNVGEVVDLRRASDAELQSAIQRSLGRLEESIAIAPRIRSDHSGVVVASAYCDVYRSAMRLARRGRGHRE